MVADFSLLFSRIEIYKRSFVFSTIQLWNNLPSEVNTSSTFFTFKNNVSNFI